MYKTHWLNHNYVNYKLKSGTQAQFHLIYSLISVASIPLSSRVEFKKLSRSQISVIGNPLVIDSTDYPMSFEDVLPSTTPKYNYQGIRQCLNIIERESIQYAKQKGLSNPYIIMDIDEDSFLKCFVELDEKLLKSSWRSYDYISQSVLIEMESNEHAAAIGAFSAIFSTWARPVTDAPLAYTASMNFCGESKEKKPDLSWTPLHSPGGRLTDWPILAGEVAWCEPRQKLVQDMKFWLQECHGQVKVALSITINACGRISIEKWSVNPGDKYTSPFVTQKIEIVPEPAPGFSRVAGKLAIKFEEVFTRKIKETRLTLF